MDSVLCELIFQPTRVGKLIVEVDEHDARNLSEARVQEIHFHIDRAARL